MRILVLSPHPDDDVIGCGGSIARHVEQGNEVTVAYMTSGEAGSPDYSAAELASMREAEAGRAAAILGLQRLIFLRNPDGYLDYNRKNVGDLVSVVRDVRPDLAYVPHHNDDHRDHMVTHKLAHEAFRSAGWAGFRECSAQPWHVPTVLCYEVWTPLGRVPYVENITPYVEKKIAALREHTSQIEKIRYDEGVRGFDRYRGVFTGKGEYCECFEPMTLPAGLFTS
jgi:LmbE family N-acetylglucosaminyl deacetylase